MKKAIICLSPVVIIADLIAEGLQVGWRVFKRPTMPDTWGHDIEVPETELNLTRRLSKACSVGPWAPVKAAIMLTPGAVISGCKHNTKQITQKMVGLILITSPQTMFSLL